MRGIARTDLIFRKGNRFVLRLDKKRLCFLLDGIRCPLSDFFKRLAEFLPLSHEDTELDQDSIPFINGNFCLALGLRLRVQNILHEIPLAVELLRPAPSRDRG